MAKTNTIITIERQFGSAGREIGERVAKEFGIRLYDQEMLDRAAPEDYPYHHNHYLRSYGTIGGNAPGHLKSLLTGNHCVFPVVEGRVKLGSAADIYFCEYDGIKNRKYMIYVMGE